MAHSSLVHSRMNLIVFVLFNFALVSADAFLADGSKFLANHGETVTIPFPMEKAEKADRLRITFTSETMKSLIAQQCDPSDGCAVVSTPGVSMIAGKGRVCLTIQRVNSSRSGIYEARAFFGKDVCEVKATLVVKEASFSSTIAPPHSSTPKPLNSDLLWLCVLIPLVIVILVGVCFWKQKKKRESADAEEARESCLQIQCLQKKELEKQPQ